MDAVDQSKEAQEMAKIPNKGRCSSKQNLLSSLISSMLQDMPVMEKKELLESVLKGGSEHKQTIEMVEH